jgi:hypothetical protein
VAFLSSPPLFLDFSLSLSLSLMHRRPCCFGWGIVSHKLPISTDAEEIGGEKRYPNDDPLPLITAP